MSDKTLARVSGQRKKGVFKEKHYFWAIFSIFYFKIYIFSSISIDFFTKFSIFLGFPEGSLIFFPRPGGGSFSAPPGGWTPPLRGGDPPTPRAHVWGGAPRNLELFWILSNKFH